MNKKKNYPQKDLLNSATQIHKFTRMDFFMVLGVWIDKLYINNYYFIFSLWYCKFKNHYKF